MGKYVMLSFHEFLANLRTFHRSNKTRISFFPPHSFVSTPVTPEATPPPKMGFFTCNTYILKTPTGLLKILEIVS